MKRFLCLILFLGGCSFKKNNQTLKGHEELYSEPDRPSDVTPGRGTKKIVLAMTNDIHGRFLPETLEITDSFNKEGTKIQIGGKKVISQYLSILRDTYKNVVLMDSGDIFSTQAELQVVADFYQDLNYDAITLGLRDFSLKLPSLVKSSPDLFKKFAKTSKVPLLLTNLFELKTARNVEWPGVMPHLLKEFDGVKVGMIGLIPDDVVLQTTAENRLGLYVESMLQSTLKQARLLRSLGADVIVVATHQGLDCHSKAMDETKLPAGKVNFDPAKPNICDKKSPLGEFIDRLPPHLVDVIIGGRTHQKMANIVNGIILLSGYPDGHSFSYVELVVDTKLKRLILEKTAIHQPVRFCHDFFKETNDCYTEDISVDHRLKIPARFLGQEITPDHSLGLNKRSSTEANVSPIDLLDHFSADLAFLPESSGETQLTVIEIPGKELAKILEEDFNAKKEKLWTPSPFVIKDNWLSLAIKGQEINHHRSYKILCDLESVRQHLVLVKQFSHGMVTTLPEYSWNSLSDEVSTLMAAQKH
jgi:hypothetical protein